MITARALGVYLYLHASGAPISAESLSSVFPEGRKAFLTALKELREAGLVITQRQLVNGKYVTQSQLNGSPKKELLLQLNVLNSYLNLNAYSLNKQERVLGEPKEGKMDNEFRALSYESEEDELKAKIRKERERKNAEYALAKEKEHIKKREAKMAKLPFDWTTDESVNEFANRMEGLWHVQPWKIARTRFRGAFGQARKTHGTNGDVEVKMMDRFFAGLEHNKTINDPEMIWKLFIRDFSSLLLDVERSTVTSEDIAVAEDISDKQWEKF